MSKLEVRWHFSVIIRHSMQCTVNRQKDFSTSNSNYISVFEVIIKYTYLFKETIKMRLKGL